MASNPELDRFDLAIVTALLKNSRKSLQEIGAEIGLSQTACWNRVKAMEQSGVILGYTIKVDLEKLGYRNTFLVEATLDTHSDETLNAVARGLDLIPEVTEAYLVSGDYDYYMKIAVKDARYYERLLREQVYKIPCVRHTKSSLVLREIKQSSFPVQEFTSGKARPGKRLK
jgi:Lrp/AsnC family transcriptional regulator, leucine-responsive regulatory protein